MSKVWRLVGSHTSRALQLSKMPGLPGLKRSLCSETASSKHLKKGDPLPPYVPGTLRLFSVRYSPYAQRARLVLAHKRLPYETVNINLIRKPDWLFERTPTGFVPVLEKDGFCIHESNVTCDWLDDVYPEEKLTPDDPHERARQRMLYETFYKITDALFHRIYVPKNEENRIKLLRRLDRYERSLDGDYFGGSEVMMVDFMLWPWFERFDVFMQGGLLDLPEERYPCIRAWMRRMFELRAVQEAMLSPALHMKWFQVYLSGNIQFDLEGNASQESSQS